MIIFIVIYILFLFAYFITRVGKNMKYRMVNKYILSSMYLMYGLVMFHIKDLPTYYYVLMIAFLFAYLGDIFLVFDFSKGGYCFLTGNICFSIFYLLTLINTEIPFINYFWIFILWASIIVALVFLFNKYPKVIKLGEMKKSMTFYLSSITLHGLLGLTSVIFIGTTSMIVMGIGSILFWISDYLLTVYRFIIQNNKWIIRGNSLTYFVGLLLIVLSIGL